MGYNMQIYGFKNQKFYFVVVRHPLLSAVKCFSTVEDASNYKYKLLEELPDIHYNSMIDIPFNILNAYLFAAYGEGKLFSDRKDKQVKITYKY